MKKIAFTLLLLFGLLPFILSQTVDSIKVEQAGDLIKVHYKILNSNQYQTFRIMVFCSINGGLKSELKSLSGDFGDNVVGGRSDYMVLWDVLKDIDEVKSVDFSVRAELIKDNTPNSQKKAQINKTNKKIYILPSIGLENNLSFGLRLAYMRNWGISAMCLRGIDKWTPSGETYSTPIYTASLDLAKRICNKTRFNMHLLTGILFMNNVDHDRNPANPIYIVHNFLGMEVGFILSFNRLAFSIGYGSTKKPGVVYIGLGMRF